MSCIDDRIKQVLCLFYFESSQIMKRIIFGIVLVLLVMYFDFSESEKVLKKPGEKTPLDREYRFSHLHMYLIRKCSETKNDTKIIVLCFSIVVFLEFIIFICS